MEAKNADLSALRINRSADPGAVPSSGRARRWLMIGLPTAGILVLAAVPLIRSGSLGSPLPVHLTPATMVSPARSGAMLVASGYVVAQRKAAVASKGTGRLVYLGVVEGDRVRAGQVIARIEDADVKAQLAQAQANLQLSRAELHDAERSQGPEPVSPAHRWEIVLAASPAVRYPGSVAMIVPTADRAKATVMVKVAFRSYDARVLPEMSAKVHFLPRPSRVAADPQPVLVVPASAVAERNGRSVVFVVQSGRAVEVPVVVGRQLGSSLAIREGLHPGVQVVDSVGARLRGGAKRSEERRVGKECRSRWSPYH